MQYAARDVLDKQLRGRGGRRMGRVDGLILELRAGEPPRVAWIEVGAVTLARRLHPRLARWVAALQARFVRQARTPHRIPWSLVRDVGLDVEVDVAPRDLPSLDWERWLSRHVMRRIPGG